MTLFSAVVLATALRSLVLPFDNLTASEEEGWIGGAAAESIGSHLEAMGEEVVSIRALQRELAERGIAPGEPLTREGLVDIAIELDADRIIVGTFQRLESDGRAGGEESQQLQERQERMTLRAEVLSGADGARIAVIEDYEDPDKIPALLNRLSKNLFRIDQSRAPRSIRTHGLRRVGLRLDAVKMMSKVWLEPVPANRIELFEQAFAVDPRYVEARLALAEALLWDDAAGNARRVMDLLNAVPSQELFYPRAYYGVGVAYLAEGEAEQARDIFLNLSKRPSSGLTGGRARAATLNNLGVAQLRLDEIGLALDAFQGAYDLDPSHTDALFNLAFANWRQGKGHKALELLHELVAMRPIDAEAHWLLAAASASQALSDEAEEARTIAFTLNPTLVEKDPATVTGLARATVTWRAEPSLLKPPRFVSDLDFLGELTRLGQAMAFADAGNSAQAIRLLQQELYHEPAASEARLALARLYRDHGEQKLAEGELQVALWHESRPELHLELADLYFEMGELGLADEQLGLLLELDPAHAEALSLKGRISESISP